MGNSPSGLENDSETDEEEEELTEGAGDDDTELSDDRIQNAAQARGFASRAGNPASRSAGGGDAAGDSSEVADPSLEPQEVPHKWRIHSPATGERRADTWHDREEDRATVPGQAHEASGRGRGSKSSTDRREMDMSPAGVMVQQEPEGSPFRQQSSQPPLEPQQHGPPSLSLSHSTENALQGPDSADNLEARPGQGSKGARTKPEGEQETSSAGTGHAPTDSTPNTSNPSQGQSGDHPRESTGNAAIIPGSSNGSDINTIGSHSFGRITTELLLAAAASLSSHPFLHRPFTLPHDIVTEFYIIRHGEASHNVSSLIGGRSHGAPLTALGEQQAMLLGKFLRTYTNLEFDAIYSSPIERALRTAHIVCRELGVPPSAIQLADALQELSQGKWEQQPRTSIYKDGVLERMTAAQPDFRAPGGESQRHVEFRMVEFINSVLFSRQHMALGDDSVWAPPLPEDVLSAPESSEVPEPQTAGSEPILAGDKTGAVPQTWSKQGTKGRGGKELPGVDSATKSVFRIAVFSHGTAIRCLLRGVMSWDPHLTHKVAIDNTSVTLLKHTVSRGWHLVKLNDTAHLVLARGPLRPY